MTHSSVLFLHLCADGFLLEPGVAQSVKHPTLDFGSGRDLTVGEFEPHIALHTDGAEPSWSSLSPSISTSSPLMLSVFQNNFFKKGGGHGDLTIRSDLKIYIFWACAVQYRSHRPYAATKRLKCG